MVNVGVFSQGGVGAEFSGMSLRSVFELCLWRGRRGLMRERETAAMPSVINTPMESVTDGFERASDSLDSRKSRSNLLKHMFYISLSFTKRKNLGQDLERDGLKAVGARSGLGISLECHGSGPKGDLDGDAVWELGELGSLLEQFPQH